MRVLPSSEAVFAAAAARFTALARNAIARRKAFHVALAGGSTPRGLYLLLAAPPWRDRVEWRRVHVWFGDERCVPPGHPDSNFKMARDALLSKVSIQPAHLHRLETGSVPARAAARYERQLVAATSRSGGRCAAGRLDLILLGMGGDGHTASLFPGAPDLVDEQRLVVPAIAAAPPRERISLTLRAINRARAVVFLVTGAEKRDAVAHVLAQRAQLRKGGRRDSLRGTSGGSGAGGSSRSSGRGSSRGSGGDRPLSGAELLLPAALVAPRGGAPVWWLLDAQAAGSVLSGGRGGSARVRRRRR
jgi:6-phosphogluconolactonase